MLSYNNKLKVSLFLTIIILIRYDYTRSSSPPRHNQNTQTFLIPSKLFTIIDYFNAMFVSFLLHS